jgi:hypothetical protein
MEANIASMDVTIGCEVCEEKHYTLNDLFALVHSCVNQRLPAALLVYVPPDGQLLGFTCPLQNPHTAHYDLGMFAFEQHKILLH